MEGRRERKKKANRQLILKSAKKLFTKQGFEKTKAEEIAELADLGVGTLYNYYKSKGDILMDMVLLEFENIQGLQKNELPPGSSYKKALFDLIASYIKNFAFFSKPLIIEIIKAAINSLASKTTTFNKFTTLDNKLIDIIEDIFIHGKNNHDLPPDFDPHLTAQLVHTIMVSELMSYAFNEDYKLGQAIIVCGQKIEMIL